MFEMRKTEKLQTVAEKFGVPMSVVTRAERMVIRENLGRQKLSEDPDSLIGLCLVGDITGRLFALCDDAKCQTVRDVVAAGRKRFLALKGFGTSSRTELEAFLASRGLEWPDDPATTDTGPAPRLPTDWNVFQLRGGGDRPLQLSANGKIRHRLVMLEREIESFRRQLGDLAQKNLEMRAAWPALETGMQLLWEGLQKADIVMGDAS
jgi:hypothetical protein